MPEIDKLLTEVGKSQFTYRLDSKTLALLYLIPSWLVCPNCPYAINQFKLVQLTNQELVGTHRSFGTDLFNLDHLEKSKAGNNRVIHIQIIANYKYS